MVETDNPLALLWIGRCTVSEQGQGTNPITKVQWFEEVTTIQDEPCRVSFNTNGPAAGTDSVTNADQQVVLFIRPDVVIPAGSRVRVTQNGRTVDYYASGRARVYTRHQEIPLSVWDNRA